jgi:hypothetical protein
MAAAWAGCIDPNRPPVKQGAALRKERRVFLFPTHADGIIRSWLVGKARATGITSRDRTRRTSFRTPSTRCGLRRGPGCVARLALWLKLDVQLEETHQTLAVRVNPTDNATAAHPP